MGSHVHKEGLIGHRGTGRQCDHSAEALGMDLGECGRDEDEGWRKYTSPRAQKATGNTRLAKLHENGGSVRHLTERQREAWRRLLPDVHPITEGEEL